MEYRARQKARFGFDRNGQARSRTRATRLRALLGPVMAGQTGDKAQQFIWRALSEMCAYAARRVPEISDSVADVDRAMRWGFGWELGPFEVWDVLGVENVAKRFAAGRPRAAAAGRAAAGLGQEIVLRIGGRRNVFVRCRGECVQESRRAGRRHHSEIAQGPLEGSRQECRRQPDRPGRRRGLLRIPRQDERHRRRHPGHAADGREAAAAPISTPWSSPIRACIFPPART